MGQDHKLEYGPSRDKDLQFFHFSKKSILIVVVKIWVLAWQTRQPPVSRVQLFIFLASRGISESLLTRQEKTKKTKQKPVSGGPNVKPLRAKLFFHDSKD